MIVRGWFEGGGRRWASGPPNRKQRGRVSMTQQMATIQRKNGNHAMEALHESERRWETLRFPGQEQDAVPSPAGATDRAQRRVCTLRAGRAPSHAPARFRTDLVYP